MIWARVEMEERDYLVQDIDGLKIHKDLLMFLLHSLQHTVCSLKINWNRLNLFTLISILLAQNEINWMTNELVKLYSGTCIRFVWRNTQADYIEIFKGNGCYSALGRIGKETMISEDNFFVMQIMLDYLGGRQQLSMGQGCLSGGVMVHEMIHALGYHHMQTDVDRDRYVRILYENISQQNRHNFDKVDPAQFGNFGTSYDLYSVMHYFRNAFGINGRDTIVPLDSRFANVIGQQQISSGDVTRLRNMYSC